MVPRVGLFVQPILREHLPGFVHVPPDSVPGKKAARRPPFGERTSLYFPFSFRGPFFFRPADGPTDESLAVFGPPPTTPFFEPRARPEEYPCSPFPFFSGPAGHSFDQFRLPPCCPSNTPHFPHSAIQKKFLSPCFRRTEIFISIVLTPAPTGADVVF